MRISDNKIVQFIDSEPPNVVIRDESLGTEIVLMPGEFAGLKLAMEYFADAMFPK